MAVAMRDGMGDPVAASLGDALVLPNWAVVWGTLGPLFAVVVLVEAWMRLAWRTLVRSGDGLIVARADAVLAGSRWCIAVIHVIGVLGLGWLDVVRSWMGDWVLLDEIVGVLPALVAGAAGWWSYAPIALTVRDAAMLGAMERGEPVWPTQSRLGYAFMQVRHGVGFIAVPLTLIAGWTDILGRIHAWAIALPPAGGPIGRIAHNPDAAPWVWLALQVAGVAGVFVVAPGLTRYVWSTVPLGPGPTRERLMDLCRRERVRISEILVWRTHGSIINGAVMGIVPWLRYVLLTDAMLDRFDSGKLEAVMAHEIGHVRRRHIPWLAAVMFTALIGGGMGVQVAVHAAGIDTWTGPWGVAGGGVAAMGSLLSLVLGIVVFGWVSRRFEWQADAFAVQHLSRYGPTDDLAPAPSDVVTPRAAGIMIGALDAVCRINHIPRWKWTFRHGSVAERQRRLHAIVGRPLEGLGIDRTVRWIKRGTIVAALLTIGAAAAAGAGVW